MPATLEHILTFFISYNFSSTNTQTIWQTNSMRSLQKDNSNLRHCNYANLVPGVGVLWNPQHSAPSWTENLIWRPEDRRWEETGKGPTGDFRAALAPPSRRARLLNLWLEPSHTVSRASMGTRGPALQDGSDRQQSREQGHRACFSNSFAVQVRSHWMSSLPGTLGFLRCLQLTLLSTCPCVPGTSVFYLIAVMRI